MSDDSEVEADMVTNTDDSETVDSVDDTSTENSGESLEGVFNRHFETLRQIYKKQTGQDLPIPSSFGEKTSLVVRGKEKTVHSSVAFDELKSSEEGEMRGVYITSDDSIRYFFYTNAGDNPTEFNSFSLRVVKPMQEDREIWAEMRISTMPRELAGKVMTPNERMREAKKGGRPKRPVKEEEEDSDETFSADENASASTVESEPEEAEE